MLCTVRNPLLTENRGKPQNGLQVPQIGENLFNRTLRFVRLKGYNNLKWKLTNFNLDSDNYHNYHCTCSSLIFTTFCRYCRWASL